MHMFPLLCRVLKYLQLTYTEAIEPAVIFSVEVDDRESIWLGRALAEKCTKLLEWHVTPRKYR